MRNNRRFHHPASRRARDLEESIARLPSIRLANLPPLQAAPRLSKTLGGPQIYFKRDDPIGTVLSENKTRKLEFSLAEALSRGVDTVVRANLVQSNCMRQWLFACNRVGLEAHAVLVKLSGEKHATIRRKSKATFCWRRLTASIWRSWKWILSATLMTPGEYGTSSG